MRAPTDLVDAVERRALELVASPPIGEEAERALITAAGADRDAVEAARDRLSRRMLGQSGDTVIGAAIGLCNRTLVRIGWVDPYDWRGRLGNRLRKP